YSRVDYWQRDEWILLGGAGFGLPPRIRRSLLSRRCGRTDKCLYPSGLLLGLLKRRLKNRFGSPHFPLSLPALEDQGRDDDEAHQGADADSPARMVVLHDGTSTSFFRKDHLSIDS